MFRQAVKHRRPVPAEIANAPELLESNLTAWRCYFELRRGHDEQVAVKWADVLLWASTYGYNVSQMEGIQESVTILDSVFVPYMRAKRKAEAEAAAKGARRT